MKKKKKNTHRVRVAVHEPLPKQLHQERLLSYAGKLADLTRKRNKRIICTIKCIKYTENVGGNLADLT